MAGYRATGGMASRAVKTEHEGQHSDPVPEKVAGTVFPYRGVQTHGVEPAQTPPAYVDDQWPDDDEAPHYVPGPTEDDPIPVRVVNQHSSFRRITRIRQVPVSTAKPLLARNDARVSASFKNIGANAVYLIPEAMDDGAALITGYKLAATSGEYLGWIGTEELYAATGDGTPSTVCVLEIIEIPT